MDTVLQDLRFALRTFLRRPGFAAVALLTLALGIGAATAIFSVVNGVLLRPFPFPEARELAVLWNTNPERGQEEYRMSGKDFFVLERSNRTFRNMALVAGATTSLTQEDAPPLRVEGSSVSANFFDVLGVRPLLGRAFLPEENQGPHRVVLLSHALWQGRFGGDPEILGKLVIMDGTPHQVVGVMPRASLPLGGGTLRLPGPEVAAYWTPLDYSMNWVSEIGAHVMAVVGRLAPGETLERAQAEMSALALTLEEEGGVVGEGIIVRSLREQIVGNIRPTLMVLLGAVGLLLLLACGNLANLLLARAADRRRELAVRTALGARRGRLARQLFTEVLLLGAVGGGLGLLVAHGGTGALLALVPSSLPRQSEIGVDGTVLLFTLGAILAATLLSGLLPSLHMAGPAPAGGLREGARGGTPGRGRKSANRLIVASQFGLAAVLLFGAGLLLRTVHSLGEVDPGFQGEGVLTAQLVLPATRYGDPARILAFYDELKARLESLPGVTSAALSMDHPMEATWWNGVTLLDQPAPREGEGPIGFFRPASPEYFPLYRIPLVEGRTFEPGDRLGEPGVMVVNQAFVRRFFPEGNPLGQRVRFIVGQAVWGPDAPSVFEVVGVVGDVRFNGLREPAEPAFHIPLGQFPYSAVKLHVKSSGDPEVLAGAVVAEVWALDPDLPVTDLRTMEAVLADATAQERFNATLLTVFALAALALAAFGVYGVLSYLVAQRTPELGIRLALGSERRAVVGMVVRDGLGMAGTGLAGGIVASLGLAPLLASLLFGVPPRDLPVLVGVGSVLGCVALVAALVPGLRAARTDPMAALKRE